MGFSQLLTFLSVLLFGIALLGATLQEGVISTLLLFVFVTTAGFWLAQRTIRQLKDPKLRSLSSFWLISIVATLILLYWGWIPMLDPGSDSWGYDPQRYYLYAQTLLDTNWSPAGIGLNYYGIIYYYASILFVFGVNPVAPALVNAFVTLLGTLFIVRIAYAAVPIANNKRHHIAWLILLPDVLWYDVMTSREMLMAALLPTVILGAGTAMASAITINPLRVTIFAFSILAILVVRTTMILPVVGSLILIALIIPKGRKQGDVFKIVLLGIVFFALFLAPSFHEIIGGSYIDFLAKFSSVIRLEENIAYKAENIQWSKNSISLLLAPNNLIEALLFIPPRMMLYLATPLPNISVSLNALLAGDWSEWQHLMSIPTAFLTLFGFPYALAGTAHAWRYRLKTPLVCIIPIGFWFVFLSVAGGNLIISERYRVMSTLLLFPTMWIGYNVSSKASVRYWSIVWCCLVAAMLGFYIIYKAL